MQYGYIVVDVNDLDVRMTWIGADDAVSGKGSYSATDSWGYRAVPRLVSFPDANLRQAVASELAAWGTRRRNTCWN